MPPLQTYAQTGSPSPTPIANSPPSILEWGTLITALIAATTWIGKNLWGYFSSKEEAESGLLKALVTDLRETQSQLLEDNKQSQLQLLKQIQFKETLNVTQIEVQRALSTQTTLYAETIERLAKMEQKIDAIHRRLDGNGHP